MAHSVDISWTASVDTVDGYNVYRGTASGSETTTPLNSALVTGTTYTDTTVIPGEYFYVVTSSKSGVESVHSNEISARILPAPPTMLVLVSAS